MSRYVLLGGVANQRRLTMRALIDAFDVVGVVAHARARLVRVLARYQTVNDIVRHAFSAENLRATSSRNQCVYKRVQAERASTKDRKGKCLKKNCFATLVRGVDKA